MARSVRDSQAHSTESYAPASHHLPARWAAVPGVLFLIAVVGSEVGAKYSTPLVGVSTGPEAEPRGAPPAAGAPSMRYNPPHE